jgi:hypothetical protein
MKSAANLSRRQILKFGRGSGALLRLRERLESR